ncbi:MAG: RNA polymerase sigma factor [Lachnospiraceae bacterium]|nr:RNA polymerase sigma factor [Lachnospiraceae bacterium]
MGSDKQLIQRIRKGDDDAIEEFVKKYYAIIMSYCRKRVHDFNLAEDLTQETFEHFFRSLSLYRHEEKVKNYLYTIAGNLCKDNYKSGNTEFLTGEADMVVSDLALKIKDESILSYDPMVGIEKEMDMKMALDKLPEIYREVVFLHFFHDLRQAEIAAVLNIKIHVVKYRIKKGKKLLRKIILERGIL